jgi:hypothetical protein
MDRKHLPDSAAARIGRLDDLSAILLIARRLAISITATRQHNKKDASLVF